MVHRLFLVAIAVLSSGTIAAKDFEDLSGTWIWSLEGRTVFVIDLTADADGFAGTLRRPANVVFSRIAGAWAVTDIGPPVVTYTLTDMSEGPEGRRLRYSAAGSDRSGEFMMRTTDEGGAILSMDADPAAPRLTLRRPRLETQVTTDWEAGRVYPTSRSSEPSSAEMAELFAADQADRESGPNIDWNAVNERDRARRARVREMLDQGLIRSGQDYLHAAFVFQHGSEPEDYLLAHVLAMAAQAKGRPDAAWIAAATLDRFLGSIERPQIFGTQYRSMHNEPFTQEPFNRDLLTDALRIAVGVPTLEEQKARQQQMEEAFRALRK